MFIFLLKFDSLVIFRTLQLHILNIVVQLNTMHQKCFNQCMVFYMEAHVLYHLTTAIAKVPFKMISWEWRHPLVTQLQINLQSSIVMKMKFLVLLPHSKKEQKPVSSTQTQRKVSSNAEKI